MATNHKKTTFDATIVGVNDDGVNYSIDILVVYGGKRQGFNVSVPVSTFNTVNECEAWLGDWVTANKASFAGPHSDSLFLGVSVTGK
jgi:hypothetical protein